MADNKSTFLDDAKQFAVEKFEQSKQLMKEDAERQRQLREIRHTASTSNMPLEAKVMLSNMQDPTQAQEFVDSYASGYGKEAYDINMKQAEVDVALTAAVPAVGKLAGPTAKVAGKIFSNSKLAQAIGNKIPALRNSYGNIFKSETELAEEARIADRNDRVLRARARAQEDIQARRAARGQQTTPNQPETTPATTQTTTPATTTAAKELATGSAIVGGTSAATGAIEESSIFGSAFNKIKKIAPSVAWSTAGYEGYEYLNDDLNRELVGNTLKDWYNTGKKMLPEKAQNWINENIEKPLEDTNIPEIVGGGIGAVAGGMMAGGASPFDRTHGGTGTLLPSSKSAEATLSSMPSGGDTGMVGEGHFGSGDVSGKSVQEILKQIYDVLVSTRNITEQISRDTASLVRDQSKQDTARDIASENLRARQNEGTDLASAMRSDDDLREREIPTDTTQQQESESANVFSKSKIQKILKFLKKAKAPIAIITGVAALAMSEDVEANIETPDNFNMSTKTSRDSQPQTATPVLSNGEDTKRLQTIALSESSGKPGVPNKDSSALGLWQFLSGTWRGLNEKSGKHYGLEDRANPEKAEEHARLLLRDNRKILSKHYGRTPTGEEEYMGWFLGAAGASSFDRALQKNPSAYAKDIMPQEARANGPMFYKNFNKPGQTPRTLQEVREIIDKKYQKAEAGLESGMYQGAPVPQTIRNIGKNEKTEIATATPVEANPKSSVLFKKSVEEQTNVETPLLQNLTAPNDKPLPLSDKAQIQPKETLIEINGKNNTNLTPAEPQVKLSDMHNISYKIPDDRDAARRDDGIYHVANKLDNLTTIIGQNQGMQQAAQATPQVIQQAPRSPAGTGVSIANVRNDEPTIKLIEEGSYWRTMTHEA